MYYMAKQDSHTDSQLKKIYELKNIAVVGMSTNKEKAGHFVPKYLFQQGFNVIPVNPTVSEVLGRRSYSTVSVPPIVNDAIDKKDHIKVIWMQEGIYNEEAERIGIENGLDVVFNRCMMAEHRRLF